MAYGTDATGAGVPAHTIYIWPSAKVVARSWCWPAYWHETFERAAALIGLGMAVCILDALPLTERRVALQLSIGRIRFRVKCCGTSIHITVSQFTGPDFPEPDAPAPDATRQHPRCADGLVLGLRGSGKRSRLVVLHGHMPAFAADGSLRAERSKPSRGPAVTGNRPTGSAFDRRRGRYLH